VRRRLADPRALLAVGDHTTEVVVEAVVVVNWQASCVSGSSRRCRFENALPCNECACAPASAFGLAVCTSQWMHNAALFTASNPSHVSSTMFRPDRWLAQLRR
jgi:hypothetical protein